MPEPKCHKKTPFAGLSTRLSLKLKPSAAENLKEVPYDLFCPKVYEKVACRTCNVCSLYFPSGSKRMPSQSHQLGGTNVPWPSTIAVTSSDEDEEPEEENSNASHLNDAIPVISNLLELIKSLWEEVDMELTE